MLVVACPRRRAASRTPSVSATQEAQDARAVRRHVLQSDPATGGVEAATQARVPDRAAGRVVKTSASTVGSSSRSRCCSRTVRRPAPPHAAHRGSCADPGTRGMSSPSTRWCLRSESGGSRYYPGWPRTARWCRLPGLHSRRSSPPKNRTRPAPGAPPERGEAAQAPQESAGPKVWPPAPVQARGRRTRQKDRAVTDEARRGDRVLTSR